LPVIPSAITAESSDSIAPRMAIANAEGSRLRTRSKVSVSAPHGSWSIGGNGGMPAKVRPSMLV
jgi:hypothetical protein